MQYGVGLWGQIIFIIRPHNSSLGNHCKFTKKVAVLCKQKQRNKNKNKCQIKTTWSISKRNEQWKYPLSENTHQTKILISDLENGICFLGMIKQLLDTAMTDIKFIQSYQIILNSGKPSTDITCLDWVNVDLF